MFQIITYNDNLSMNIGIDITHCNIIRQPCKGGVFDCQRDGCGQY